MHWLRSMGAVLVGLFVASCLMLCSEVIGSVLFPLPPEVDPHHLEQIRKLAEDGKIPVGAHFFVLAGWLLGSFAGSWVAARLSNFGQMACGLIIGGYILLGCAFMFSMLPHPLIVILAAVILVPLASYLGAVTALPNQPLPAESKSNP